MVMVEVNADTYEYEVFEQAMYNEAKATREAIELLANRFNGLHGDVFDLLGGIRNDLNGIDKQLGIIARVIAEGND